uniref:Uncharacterized protein n=1 Tax=Romanomermis culicivorax TaxID=13658 RepID=A0A915K9B0_ROMCU
MLYNLNQGNKNRIYFDLKTETEKRFYNYNRCSVRSYGKRSLTIEQEINFDTLEMVEKGDHQIVHFTK